MSRKSINLSVLAIESSRKARNVIFLPQRNYAVNQASHLKSRKARTSIQDATANRLTNDSETTANRPERAMSLSRWCCQKGRNFLLFYLCLTSRRVGSYVNADLCARQKSSRECVDITPVLTETTSGAPELVGTYFDGVVRHGDVLIRFMIVNRDSLLRLYAL